MLFTTNSPFSFVKSGLGYCSQQASTVAASAVKYTANFAKILTFGVSELLPDWRVKSISSVIAQATEHGSAILDLGVERGEVFIEITKNERGQRVFTATGGMLEPVVFTESPKEARKAVWEARVSEYLVGCIDENTTEDYGAIGRRWKGAHFFQLKTYLAEQGIWEKEGDQVTLSLPDDDEELVFSAPYAEQKAEIALKYLYHRKRTPIEEEASRGLDFITHLFVGSMAVSGPLFAPWVGREPPILERNPQRDSCSLPQNLLSAATAGATTMLAVSNPTAAFIATVLALSSKGEAFSIDGYSNDATIMANARKADAAARQTIARRTSPITVVNPLPALSTNPGFPISLPINLPTYFSISTFDDNLDLTQSQVNGSLPSNWLSLGMGPITLQKAFSYGTSLEFFDIIVQGTIGYVAAGYCVLTLDLSNLNNPIVLGQYTVFATLMCISGTEIYVADSSTQTVTVLNAANPSNITLKSTLNFAQPIYGMTMNNGELYVKQIKAYQTSNVTVLNTTSASGPTEEFSVSWSSPFAGGSTYYVNVYGPTVYVGDIGPGEAPQVRVFNKTSTNMTLTTIIPNVLPSNVVINGRYLYTLTLSGLATYDNINPSNPVLIQTAAAGSATSAYLLLEGSFLYVFTGDTGVFVFSLLNPANPTLATFFATISSAVQGAMCQNTLLVSDLNVGITIFNLNQRTFSGTTNNPGLYLPQITATDDLGNSVTQTVPVHVGPIPTTSIPDQQVYVGNSTMFTFAPFPYPGATFTYTATLANGDPLPGFISFNSSAQMFLVAPSTGTQGTYTVKVTGDDGYGGTASTTFNVVVPDRTPYAGQPLANQTAISGSVFQYVLPSNTFGDADNDLLTLNAAIQGTLAAQQGTSTQLPGWLGFDPVLRTFTGSPFGKGVYTIIVTATDPFGKQASESFTITVPPSAPQVDNPIGTQTASVGNPFSYIVNTNTFFSADKLPLTLSSGSLPAGIRFDNSTNTFYGTPQTAGSSTIVLTATDTDNLSVTTSFILNVLGAPGVNPPVLAVSIPNLDVKAGVPFNYTFDSNTFVDPANLTMTYKATTVGGGPLPTGVTFNSATRTFTGTLPSAQTLTVSVYATDPFGGFAVCTFNIIAVQSTPPIVLNPLPDTTATVGAAFIYPIPPDTFTDLNMDPININIFHEGDLALPSWIHWDPKTMTVTGTPGPEDTNTYQIKVVTVNVWATNDVGSAKTSFNINVGGDSTGATLIKYIFSVGALTLLYKAYQERAFVWNFFNKSKYKRDTQNASIGEQFYRKLELGFIDIKKIKVHGNGNRLPLPPGLIHSGDSISGTPLPGTKGYYTITVVDRKGYNNERFDLIIRDSLGAPEKYVSTIDYLTALPSRAWRYIKNPKANTKTKQVELDNY